MANQEKDNFGSRHEFDQSGLKELGEKQQEQLRKNIERNAETNQEKRENTAKHEALEQAEKTERDQQRHESKKRPTSERLPTRKDRDNAREKSFKATIQTVQSQLPAASRVFSRVIHNKTVEKVSDVTGNTVARPNAILSGAVFAFILTLVVYIIARYYGYPLSGAETIASFVLGWVLGNIFDYIRVLILGKNH